MCNRWNVVIGRIFKFRPSSSKALTGTQRSLKVETSISRVYTMDVLHGIECERSKSLALLMHNAPRRSQWSMGMDPDDERGEESLPERPNHTVTCIARKTRLTRMIAETCLDPWPTQQHPFSVKTTEPYSLIPM